jgi:RNA polymerase sigma-54 factor
MDITPCELKKAQEQLLSLNPKPGNGFSKDTAVPYIFPDLFVVNVGDDFRVLYNDFTRPRLEINTLYQNLLKTADQETKAYIQDKLIKAKDMLSSIDQRRSTVLNCAEAVLARQKAYFEHGAGHLAPMTLSDIADDIGVHKSTVSRAISGKAIQSSRGVQLLGELFSRNISKDTEGKTQDMALVQIKKIIAKENPNKPLSDQKIAEELERIGIAISRRTVAKYRDLVGIVSAGGRKRLS